MKTKILSAALLAASMFTQNAFAVTHVETGDAGQTLGTAQAVAGGVDQITGTSNGTADLFSFYWGGGAFYANTVGSTGDSQLFLFDSAGMGVWGNDDGIAFAGPAYISDANLTAGLYYIGASGYNYDPRDAAGNLIFQSSPFGPVYGPNAGAGALASWSGGNSGTNYSINFQQITSNGTSVGGSTGTGSGPTGVPEASTLALFGLGLFGLGFTRRNKKS